MTTPLDEAGAGEATADDTTAVEDEGAEAATTGRRLGAVERARPLTLDEIRERTRATPWWRRPRGFRRQLAWTLVGTALVSILLVGGLNFFAAGGLLNTGTKDQLVGIGQARARSIALGLERTVGQVSAVSRDLQVVAALEELSAEFEALQDATLTDEQAVALEEEYRTGVVEPFNELVLVPLGEDPIAVDDVSPASTAGRYLQYHYIIRPNIDGVTDRRTITDPGDGSGYSAAHAVHHPALEAGRAALGLGDVLLVNRAGDVVYSTDKRIDLGTNVVSGVTSDTELARVLTETLPRVRTGNTVIADTEIYLPGGGDPVLWMAAAIQSDRAVIGALAVQIPIEAVNQITTAGQRWEEVGLQNGESYLVGSDSILRSESRAWIEDRAGYLGRVDDEVQRSLIDAFDSPVGIQVVDTEPVRRALENEEFSGEATNYLGTDTFSYATQLGAPGVSWVVVVDVPLDDARDPLLTYAWRLGIVMLILLPSAALLGLWMARRLTRPIPKVLEMAGSIVDGERHPEVPDLPRDEFGDLASRLGRMANELGEREQALAAEYDQRRELMLSVLPPRLVEETGEVAGSGEMADVATAISVLVAGDVARFGDDEDRQVDALDAIARLADEAMGEGAVERIRASADGYLFVAGGGTPEDGVDDALHFAHDLAVRVAEFSELEQVDVGLRVGIATGPVATGLLERGSLTFGAWGLPVRKAMAVAALAEGDEILVDASTASNAGDEFDLRPSVDVVALDGEPMELFALGR